MRNPFGPALLLLLPGLLCPLPAPAATAEQELERGSALLDARRYQEAYAAFEAAASLSAGPCGQCALGMATAGNRGGLGDPAAAARRAVAALPPGDLTVAAYNQLGIALFRIGQPKELEEAAGAFRRVVELTGGRAVMARKSLGETLLKLGRDEEGRRELEAFLALQPSGPDADRARALIADPRRAREQVVPAFRFTTLGGEELTPERLKGKVVLFDFWATWCQPCREALPEMKRLRAQLAKEPFVLVGVAADADEAVVRKYVEENGVVWPQVFDRNGRSSKELFGVNALPFWLLVGADGAILATGSGWSPSLGELVAKKAREAVRKAKG